MPEFLTKINWVDIVCAAIFLRVIYVSRKTGIVIELSKLLILIFSTFLSLHYFLTVSDLTRKQVNLEKSPLQFTDFIIFVLLLVFTYAVLSLFRSIIFNLIRPREQAKPTSLFSGLAGVALSIVRGFLISSLIVFSLYISNISYLTESSQKAHFSKKFFGMSTGIYKGLWENLASKFLSNEKVNSVVFEHEKEFYK